MQTKGWEVEWCANVPKDEDGENLLDDADYRIKDFKTREAAIAFAKKIFPKDWFGGVKVTAFEIVPIEPGYPGMEKEYVGETEYVERVSGNSDVLEVC